MSSMTDFLKARGAAKELAELADPRAVATAVAAAKAGAEDTTTEKERNALHTFLTGKLAQENPAAYAEIRRIVGLPVVRGYPEHVRENLQREIIEASHYERGFRLHDLQCDAILTYREHGCLFGPIGVGWGKTLITETIAGEAYRKGIRQSMLIIPPQLMAQLTKRDLPWARARVALYGCPFIPVVGSPARRLQIAQSGKVGCYIVPSSMLSTRNAQDVIEAIAPQLIIGDEAHMLRNVKKSARAKRVMKYVNDHQPEVVWLSGTITSKSVLDYLHLVRAMGGLCPLPTKLPVAYEWAAVLDSNAEPNERNTGPIRPLIEWAEKNVEQAVPYNGRGFRLAYKERLLSNPAVVATGDKELGVTLIISHQRVDPEASSYEGGEKLRELQNEVDELWVAPNGDEIDHAFHKFRWLFELSGGIYNDLYWPDAEVVAKRRNLEVHEAEELLVLAQELHEYTQNYHKVLRGWLQSHHIKDLDTPFLVAGHMARNGARGVDPELYMAWKTIQDFKAEHPSLPDRDSCVVRVCDYKVRYAEAWAREKQEGIIWYYNNGVGEWLKEIIPDAIYCPAGKAANELLADPENTRGKLVIASISAHCTGKNLQHMKNQLYVQWPRPADTSEQVLGRLHRNGQEEDEIVAEIAADLPVNEKGKATFDELLYAAMLNDALYIHQTTGSRQKVVYANYDPLPRVFPAAVLEERGFELQHRLSTEEQARLEETFRAG